MHDTGISTYQFIPYYASSIHKHTRILKSMDLYTCSSMIKLFEDSEPTGIKVNKPVLLETHSSGAVWESRWPSWAAVRPNEPSGFHGRKAILGKIQGDGRKFLDHLKSYFGLQISSQSLNEVHMFRLQPKSATKGEFFHIFLSLIVSSSRLMLPFDVWPSFPVTTWTLPYADFGKIIVLTSERSQIAIFSVHFSRFIITVACWTRPLT